MSLTVQNIIDEVKLMWGKKSTADGDTADDAFLLSQFNKVVYPVFRNIYLRTDQHYFDEIGYATLASGTDTYQPTHDSTQTAYSGGAKRIRRLYGIWVKDSSQDDYWIPLTNVENRLDESQQANNSTSYRVYGYRMLGNTVQVVDIPDYALTHGLKFQYTPEMTAFAAADTLTIVLDDDAHLLIFGLCLSFARKARNQDMIRQYQADYILAQREVKRAAMQRIDANMQLEDAGF